MQGIRRRSVRCLVNPVHVSSLHSGPGHTPRLPSLLPQVSRLKCVLQSEENDPVRRVRKRLRNAYGPNVQYSYKRSSSTPIGYPKYEMEFPQWHSKSAGGRHEVVGQLRLQRPSGLCVYSLRLPEKWLISQFRRQFCALWNTWIARRSVCP